MALVAEKGRIRLLRDFMPDKAIAFGGGSCWGRAGIWPGASQFGRSLPALPGCPMRTLL